MQATGLPRTQALVPVESDVEGRVVDLVTIVGATGATEAQLQVDGEDFVVGKLIADRDEARMAGLRAL